MWDSEVKEIPKSQSRLERLLEKVGPQLSFERQAGSIPQAAWKWFTTLLLHPADQNSVLWSLS